jgi:protein-serine/threonine kinase
MAQPTATNGKRYDISSPMASEDDSDYGRPSVSQGIPSKFARISGMDGTPVEQPARTHKRSSTISSMSEKIFGRHGSIFGGKPTAEKPKKSYPPVSYSGASTGVDSSRQSIDSSRRSISFGFGKKRSGSVAGSTGGDSGRDKPARRFSLIPAGFSLKAIGIGKDYDSATATPTEDDQYYDDGIDRSAAYGTQPPVEKAQARPQTNPVGVYDRSRSSPQQDVRAPQTAQPHQHYTSTYDGTADYAARKAYRPATQDTPPPAQSDTGSFPNLTQTQTHQPPLQGQSQRSAQRQGYADYDERQGRQGRGVLQKNNRRFTEAYEGDGGQDQGGYGGQSHTSGSSGAARKVMDFFRRRGRAREGEM